MFSFGNSPSHGCRVTLVKSIARKICHQIKDITRIVLWYFIINRTFDKRTFAPSPRPSFSLCTTQCKSASPANSSPFLEQSVTPLLIDYRTIGFENGFQNGIRYSISTTMLTINERINHPRRQRTRTI